MVKRIAKMAIVCAASLFIGITVNRVFHPCMVYGDSMKPSFNDGDIVMCGMVSGPLRRGDIVISGKGFYQVIKRVVGVPGDCLEIRDGILFVDGERSPFNEIPTNPGNVGVLSSLYEVPEDSYFLLGDNRNHSFDSRIYGAVSVGNIKYRVKERIFEKRGK